MYWNEIQTRLEQHFNEHNIELLTEKINDQTLAKAAILIPLFQHHNEVFVLLTKRSDELRSHSGEVCFPGGKLDEQDENIFQAAKREAFEEIGLHESNIKVLGQLMPIITTYNLAVFPIVCYIKDLSEVQLKLNKHEVADVFACPLHIFLTSPTGIYKGIFDFPQHTFTWVKDCKLYLYQKNSGNEFLRQTLCDSKNGSFNIWGLTALFSIITASVCLEKSPDYIPNLSAFYKNLKLYFSKRLAVLPSSKL